MTCRRSKTEAIRAARPRAGPAARSCRRGRIPRELPNLPLEDALQLVCPIGSTQASFATDASSQASARARRSDRRAGLDLRASFPAPQGEGQARLLAGT